MCPEAYEKKREREKRELLSEKNLIRNCLTRFRKELKKTLNILASLCDRRAPPPPSLLPLFHAHSQAPIESTKHIKWSSKIKSEKKKNSYIHHEKYADSDLRSQS